MNEKLAHKIAELIELDGPRIHLGIHGLPHEQAEPLRDELVELMLGDDKSRTVETSTRFLSSGAMSYTARVNGGRGMLDVTCYTNAPRIGVVVVDGKGSASRSRSSARR